MKKSSDKKAKKFEQFDGQHEDEEVFAVFRRHPVVMRKGLIGMLVVILISMLPITFRPENIELLWLIAMGLLAGIAILFYVWIGWYFSLLIMTNQRLVQMNQTGLFNRSVVDIGIDKIQNVNYQINGLQQTLLGFGTIVVQTFVGDLVIHNMHKPKDVAEELIKVIREYGGSEEDQ